MFSTQPSYDAVPRCHPNCDAFDDEFNASCSTVTGKTYSGGSALRRMTFFFDCESDEEDVYEEDEVSPSDSSASSSSESSGCLSRCRSFSSIEDEYEEELLSEVNFGSVESISVKRVSSTSAALVELLNSDEYRSDSWNHAVHVQQIVPHGDEAFVLKKKLHDASSTIHTVRDAFEFIRQALEGLVFFHENFIARVPMSPDNIRADVGPSPASEEEADSDIPVRYYYSDLEGAGCFEREGDSWKDGLTPCDGDNSEVDPFADDVYRFDSMLTSMFKTMPNLHALTSTMTSLDRSARPSAASALESLEQLCVSLDPTLLDNPVEVSC